MVYILASGIGPKIIIIILYILQSRSSKDEIPAKSLILSVPDVSLCMHVINFMTQPVKSLM